MPTIIYDKCGFSDQLTPAPLVKETIKIIADQVDQKFPDEINLVVDATWIHFQTPYDDLKQIYLENPHIDNFFLIGTADIIQPFGINYPSNPNLKLFQIGSISDDYFQPYRLEWGIWSSVKLFQSYTDQDIKLFYSPNITPYICYQNKPHEHRQLLTYKLQQENLLDKGIVTLNKYDDQDFLYPGLTRLTVPEYISRNYYLDSKSQLTDPIDQKQIPYSLGELRYWQNSFLNVVSETFPNDGGTPFISEKTVKPILGLRPFIINGNYRIERTLNQRGIEHHLFLNDVGVPLPEWITDDSEKIIDNCVRVIKEVCSWPNQKIFNYYRNTLLEQCKFNKLTLLGLVDETEIKMKNIFKHFIRYKLPNQDQNFREENNFKLRQHGINL